VAGRMFPIALMLGAALWPPLRLAGQQSGGETPALKQELGRLGAAAVELEHSLPSLTCQETGKSEFLVGGKTKKRDEFTATLRAKRDSDGALDETFEVTKLNGKSSTRRDFRFPFYVSGGFDRAMRYFAPMQQACYRYSLGPGRIDFVTAADVALHPQCVDEGMRGFALLDAQGNVLHVERTVSSKEAQERGIAPFASIDFGDVELNGTMFRLSRHMLSQSTQGRFGLRFDATYSDCRMFTATVKIGPVIELEPATDSGDAPGQPHP
jgi:hypothetical protein